MGKHFNGANNCNIQEGYERGRKRRIYQCVIFSLSHTHKEFLLTLYVQFPSMGECLISQAGHRSSSSRVCVVLPMPTDYIITEEEEEWPT